MDVRIERLVWQGRGFTRDTNGRVILVEPEVLPGELVRITPVKEQKQLIIARPVRILEESNLRRQHPCASFLKGCGGCRFGYTDAKNALALKTDMLRDVIRRNFGQDAAELLAPHAVHSSPAAWGYRYRAQIHVRSRQPYFSVARSNTLVPVRSCALLAPCLSERMEELAARLPDGRHCIAASPLTAESCTQYEDKKLSFSLPDFDIFWQQSAAVFFQANWQMNNHLVREVVRSLNGVEQIADFYCGSGNFTLPLGRQGARVLGIETSDMAVETGRQAALKNGLEKKCHFQQADILRPSAWNDIKKFQAQAAILDPPRTGAPGIAQYLTGLPELERVAWISCDAVNTCRDIKPLLQNGWNLRSVLLFDMFVQTWHMEVLFLLEKNASQRKSVE